MIKRELGEKKKSKATYVQLPLVGQSWYFYFIYDPFCNLIQFLVC